MPEQNYQNHARIVRIYHIGVFFPLLANFIWAIYHLSRGITGEAAMGFILSLALLLMFLSIRTQVLTVQDRIVRLESRLRMREVLPPDLATRAAALPIKQVVALRFASDKELPELVGDVLAGKLTTPKEIKMRVKDWQADHLRA